MDRRTAIKYLPVFLNKKVIHYPMGQGNNDKLVNVLLSLFPLAVSQTKNISKFFRGINPEQSARNIYNFLRQEITYKADDSLEQRPKLPSALINTGVGDCKSYALFSSAIMYNLYNNAQLEFCSDVSYTNPTHIYGAYNNLVIDGTYKNFNKRIPNIKYKKTYNMQIDSITGKRYNEDPIEGWLKDAINKVKDTVKKAADTAGDLVRDPKQAARKLYLAIPRQAFLGLVSLNVRSFATKLNRNRNTALSLWTNKAGGTASALNRAINDGMKKRAIFGNYYELQRDGFVPINYGIGEPVTAATITASITAAVPVIVILNTALKESKEFVQNFTRKNQESQNITNTDQIINSTGTATGLDFSSTEETDKPDYIKPLIFAGLGFAVLKITKII